jgi:hypothetical protein
MGLFSISGFTCPKSRLSYRPTFECPLIIWQFSYHLIIRRSLLIGRLSFTDFMFWVYYYDSLAESDKAA